MDLSFSDYDEVDPAVIDAHSAFDVSLVSDLPLFIDPFHLFHSDDEKFRELHESIVRYLKFLRDRAGEPLTKGAMETRILRDLGLENEESIVVIDARADNKPSASNA